jgi:hypothetical protein
LVRRRWQRLIVALLLSFLLILTLLPLPSLVKRNLRSTGMGMVAAAAVSGSCVHRHHHHLILLLPPRHLHLHLHPGPSIHLLPLSLGPRKSPLTAPLSPPSARRSLRP